MSMITVGLNEQHAKLWKTSTWTGGSGRREWQAEERRIAAQPLDALLGLDPADLDDWQRCLVAERLISAQRKAEALRVLAPVGSTGTWHPAVAYPDLFEALAQAWRDQGALDRRVEVCERSLAYTQSHDPENVRMSFLDLAEALCDAGRVDDAVPIFVEQVRDDPLDPWPYWFMGTSFAANRYPAWAAIALRRGLTVLDATGDPEQLTDQFQDQLREAETASSEGNGASLPEALETALNGPLPRMLAKPHTEPAARPVLLPSPSTGHRAGAKVGRNDPCPCGSGLKYKRCCARR